MSTLEMERGGDVLVHHAPVQTVPDHVPADVAAEHPDAASVVAGRPTPGPVTVRVVDRMSRRSRAGLVLALAACALVAAFAGGGTEGPDVVRVRATTPPAATTVSTVAPASSCAPGSSVVAVCHGPACLPAPLAPFGICRPAASRE